MLKSSKIDLKPCKIAFFLYIVVFLQHFLQIMITLHKQRFIDNKSFNF